MYAHIQDAIGSEEPLVVSIKEVEGVSLSIVQ
jgi:hypothetical protein